MNKQITPTLIIIALSIFTFFNFMSMINNISLLTEIRSVSIFIYEGLGAVVNTIIGIAGLIVFANIKRKKVNFYSRDNVTPVTLFSAAAILGTLGKLFTNSMFDRIAIATPGSENLEAIE